MKLEEIRPIIEQFSAVTNTIRASEIPLAYERQIEHFNNMSKYSVSLEAKLAETNEHLRETQKRLNDARYQRNEKMKTLDNEIEEIKVRNAILYIILCYCLSRFSYSMISD